MQYLCSQVLASGNYPKVCVCGGGGIISKAHQQIKIPPTAVQWADKIDGAVVVNKKMDEKFLLSNVVFFYR